MPKITEEELVKVQVRLFKSDMETLKSLYGGQLLVNKVIRSIVRSFITQTTTAADKAIDEIEEEELLLDLKE